MIPSKGMRPKTKESDGEEPVGPKRRQSAEVTLSPSVPAITAWTVDEDPGRLIAIVVPGATHFDRQEVIRQYAEGEWLRFHSGLVIDAKPPKTTEWLAGNVAGHFMDRIRLLSMPSIAKGVMAPWYPHVEGEWELLWNLIAVEEFIVDDPLRQMIDKPFYLVHDVHRMLWEARFLAREHSSLQPTEALMVHFTRWITGEPLGDEGRKALASIGINRLISSHTERLDVVCFLLSLACQNGLLERAIFLFDDLEHALQPNKRSVLRQLRDLLDCGRRWARIGGSPLGILIGFTGSRTDLQLLAKYNTVLMNDVTAGLAWARRTLSS
jgi:hypothetical protein